MKPLIVYCSRTGNTEKIMQAVGDRLHVDLAPAEDISAEYLRGRPSIGLASGIYWARHAPALFKVVDLIPQGTKVFIMSSSGFKNRTLVGIYTFMIKRKIRRAGLRLVGEWHCPGHDRSKDPLFSFLKLSKGRPDDTDLAEAAIFVRKMIHDGSQ